MRQNFLFFLMAHDTKLDLQKDKNISSNMGYVYGGVTEEKHVCEFRLRN